MSGIIPDEINGGILVTNEDGTPAGSSPQPGLFLGQVGDGFHVSGGLFYLSLPSVGGSCGGRIMPGQINAIVSELLALMDQWSPDFTYNPGTGNNLALAFDNFFGSVSTVPAPIESDAGKMLVAQSDGSLKWASDADIVAPPVAGSHRGWRFQMNAGHGANTNLFEVEFREHIGVSQGSTGGSVIDENRLTPGWPGPNAFDGDIATKFVPGNSSSPSSVAYIYTLTREVRQVAIYLSTSVAPPAGLPTDIQIDFSDDNGATWTTAVHLTSAVFANNAWTYINLPTASASVDGARIKIQNARDLVGGIFIAANDGKFLQWDDDTQTFTLAVPQSVPNGGSTGQVLTKNSGSDGDAAWVTPTNIPNGGTAGQVLTKNTGTDGDASWRYPPSLPSTSVPGDTGKTLVVQPDGTYALGTDADTVGAVSAKNWRVLFNDGMGAYLSVNEIQFREVAGTAQSSTGGTAYDLSHQSSGVAANAFDGSTSSAWWPNANPDWIAYAHATARLVREVAIHAVGSGGTVNCTSFDVQYYDGSNWITARAVRSLTTANWTNNGWSLFSIGLGASGAQIRFANGRDVNVAGVTDKQFARYDAATSKWVKWSPKVGTQTAAYTLALDNADGVVVYNSASGANITVPPNSAVAFPIGTTIDLYQFGAGTLTVAQGSGVTVNAVGGTLALSSQYQSAQLRKIGTDLWYLAKFA